MSHRGELSLSNVVDKLDFTKPVVRRKIISASNDGSMATKINVEGFPDFTFDEPAQHGGSDLGPTPLTGVLSALCACKAVTFNRTAEEFGFNYSGIEFSASLLLIYAGGLASGAWFHISSRLRWKLKLQHFTQCKSLRGLLRKRRLDVRFITSLKMLV